MELLSFIYKVLYLLLSIPTHVLECQFKPKYQELGLFFDVAKEEGLGF